MPIGKGPGWVLDEKECNFKRKKDAQDTTVNFLEFKKIGIIVKKHVFLSPCPSLCLFLFLHTYARVHAHTHAHTHTHTQVVASFSIALEVRETFCAPGQRKK